MKDAILDVCAFLLWPIVILLFIGIIWFVYIGYISFIFAAVLGIIILILAKWMDG